VRGKDSGDYRRYDAVKNVGETGHDWRPAKVQQPKPSCVDMSAYSENEVENEKVLDEAIRIASLEYFPNSAQIINVYGHGGDSSDTGEPFVTVELEGGITKDDGGMAISIFKDSVYVDSVYMPKGTSGKGYGTAWFDSLINEAQAAGKSEINLLASRMGDDNGYYTWARFGFDAEIPLAWRYAIKKEGFTNVTKISDFMSSERGRAWWKANGATIEMSFDLSPNSHSMQTWKNYLEEKTK